MRQTVKKRKHILLASFCWLLAVVMLCCVAAVALFFYAIKPAKTTSGKSAALCEYELHVPNGMSVMQAAIELEEHGIIHSRYFLYAAARYNLFDRTKPFNMKSGAYKLSNAMSLEEIYYLLQTGSPENIKVSVPEGLTITKVAALLQEAGLFTDSENNSQDAFVALCHSQALLDEYGIASSSVEGYLFPDTYFFTEGMSVKDIARTFLDNFFEKISSIDSLSGISREALNKKIVLASIVEREYRRADEAPQNRLNNGIGLYSCATIEYIITEIEGRPHPNKITYEDLKIDSPYNTYKWAELPPTAISNPGLVAIKAAANPPETDYFYFVLTNPESGSHTFSKSFEGHIKAENGLPSENLYTKPAAK